MERKQFTFYESFYDAVSMISKKSDRLDLYEAIIRYGLRQEEPTGLSVNAALAFKLVRPVLDSGRKKAANARKSDGPQLVLRHLE